MFSQRQNEIVQQQQQKRTQYINNCILTIVCRSRKSTSQHQCCGCNGTLLLYFFNAIVISITVVFMLLVCKWDRVKICIFRKWIAISNVNLLALCIYGVCFATAMADVDSFQQSVYVLESQSQMLIFLLFNMWFVYFATAYIVSTLHTYFQPQLQIWYL